MIETSMCPAEAIEASCVTGSCSGRRDAHRPRLFNLALGGIYTHGPPIDFQMPSDKDAIASMQAS
ncbi:hypothetical protein HSR122_1939 [Halapricum desulfuricans]|uniref:Uncharacterized protein n=1 Tax=Halapricum desulfuricans TaxID=2841257 RepID=A0A897NA33_9EURY|nr:hypothetical protein HSR122_1939 [Halapricum desulfuricans]